MENETKTNESSLKEITTFTHGSKTYKLVEPSAAVVREAKRRRGIKFVQAIKDEIFTKKQLQDILTERSPEFFLDFNSARGDVLRNISETEELLEAVSDPEQLMSLSHILIVYRAQLVEQEQMIREMFESTAEEIADAEKNSYLVYAMLRDEEGNVIDKSYDQFLEDVSFEFFDSCKYRLLCWEHNLDPNWQSTLPEAKAVLRAQSIILNEAKDRDKDKDKDKEAKAELSDKEKPVKKKTNSKSKSKPKQKAEPKASKSKKAKTTVKKKAPTAKEG